MKPITIYVKDPEKQLKTRKHHKPKNWSKVYFYYKKKHKTKIKKNKIINVLDKVGHYQQDTFYKIESMSNKDSIFDYYRVLKKKDKIQYLEIEQSENLNENKLNNERVFNFDNSNRILSKNDLIIKF